MPEIGTPLPGAWSRDDVILFNSQLAGVTSGVVPLVRVSASGGTVTPATAAVSGK